MAQVALDGKLSCQILLAFQVLPSDIPSPSFRHSKSFLPTGKVFLSDRKSFSFRQEKSFLPTGKVFLSDRKSFSFRHSESFLPTFRVLPSDRKSPSFRQDTNECPTYHQPSPFQSQKNRKLQNHNRLTKTKHLHFSSLLGLHLLRYSFTVSFTSIR
ncbi:hypothetical protein TVAG_006530 [Trichomonas vaginalis G3]|uniref:Uncharacterized protein n=1 Tax=Trichomonas vaginalis (strain ATCC PRA-98 / G3) TaxID=412133 RepID=A2FTD4_TRIV3|nr:hypothetical protein TVAGG3_0546810 [Trichomonas vaginalis G3]EAX91819.1 hypothetical protein TVAG_006530 [Trichomonas vaginalis G3]KAI5520239.1 hypothetical protein TVAGG3_0546810 [Trichomonas vaginalis G3]|eukprot:XP_001304749.1 hypothetical protein [Trichomonas vaginalis G3]